jgi:hypothetical protein
VLPIWNSEANQSCSRRRRAGQVEGVLFTQLQRMETDAPIRVEKKR